MQIQLSVIYRNPFLLILLLISFMSCDRGDGGESARYKYDLSVSNKSDVTINIFGYRTKNIDPNLNNPQLINSISLSPDESEIPRTLVLSNEIQTGNIIYPGFENRVDSVVLKFNNSNKGYIVKTVLDSLVLDKWISNKSSFLGMSYLDLVQSNNVYYYNITQQDYENAPDL